MLKLIILDRDGVINYDSPDFIKSPDEWHAVLGSLAAIAALNRAGFKVCVATNQSGIARGYYDLETLTAIHEKMRRELAKVDGHVDAIFYCPHKPDDHCDCRKPKPGLYLQALKYFDVKPEEALIIGDSLRDITAAHAAGCDAILVKSNKGDIAVPDSVPVYENLAEAVQILLKNMR